MTLREPRIPALQDDEFSESQAELLKNQKMRGSIQNIFRTLANHEKLAKRWMVFANHCLLKNSLPERDREIAIMRTGWLCQSEYEWGQHVLIAKGIGMTDEELAGIQEGESAACWSDHDKLIIRAANELRSTSFVSDEVWDGLSKSYSTEQMMDLVFTCGQYAMLAGALNSFGVQLDDDLEGF